MNCSSRPMWILVLASGILKCNPGHAELNCGVTVIPFLLSTLRMSWMTFSLGMWNGLVLTDSIAVLALRPGCFSLWKVSHCRTSCSYRVMTYGLCVPNV